jgi:hypothetical protein
MQWLCSNMQQGVQLLTLCMTGQEGLHQAALDLRHSMAEADKRVQGQLVAFACVLEAAATREADALAQVSAAVVHLATSHEGLSTTQLQQLSSHLGATLTPLERQHRELHGLMLRLQQGHAQFCAHAASAVLQAVARPDLKSFTVHCALARLRFSAAGKLASSAKPWCCRGELAVSAPPDERTAAVCQAAAAAAATTTCKHLLISPSLALPGSYRQCNAG